MSEGSWQVAVAVTGEQGAGRIAGFDVDIEPARGFGKLRLGIGGMAVIVGVWVLGSMREESPARARRKRPAPKPR